MLFQRRQSERMFEAYIRKRFKANSTPFDISASSAFKPTKPLEIHQHPQHQLQQQQHQPLISPITGQPLSHVPAPLLLSSSTHSTAGSSFRLGRSSTQPRLLQLTVTGTPAPTPANSSHSLQRQHSVSDSINASLSEQLTLSVGNNDTEHIFEMSGIDNDSAIQSLSEDASTATQSSTSVGVGVARSNSVRARANMFQQLQEQSRSRREAAGREQLPAQSRSFASSQAVTPHHSPPPSATAEAAVASSHNSLNDEPSTPNTTQDTTDADFEPSSLSLAERLAFFSSLCESAACGSGGATAASGSARLFSRPNSSCNSRSPPIDRLTRSSTAGSSGNVTPTPMECSPIINDLKQEQPMEPKQQQQQQQQQQHQQTEQELPPTHNGFYQLTRSATAPTPSTATVVTTTTTTTPLQNGAPPATRRMRVRTVGKLVLPATFLSDRNKSDNSNSSNGSSSHRSSCIGRLQTLEDIHISMGVRTIGKIKSPFIEQQQQQRQQQQQDQSHQQQQQSKSAKMDQQRYSNGASDSGSDSGKENQAANQQKQQQQQQDAQQRQQQLDMHRKHFSHITVQQMPPQQSINRRHTTELSGSPIGTVCMGNNRPKVNERYAKYFGLDESSTSSQLLKTEALNEHVRVPASQMSSSSNSSNSNSNSKSNTSINKSSSSTSISSNNSNTSMVQRRREMLKRTRAMSMETSMCDGGSISPTAVPSAKRAHSPAHSGVGLNRIASFEDIVVTQDELHAAGHEFKRLCGEILGT
ncbi:putative uncharacterized protein DDB_G0277255 isoform X16 [Drosophila navojoa]|uniref:putative uncharacterized protein DDB_G0277255 isoform X16 n=1 Tax=Drosophila navojoa TaxID=7232 RepID=UPI0011BE3ED4|nr:putative uncharacterized protein DDB_G0277255 isoform X16 [Drosophila navojoa]